MDFLTGGGRVSPLRFLLIALLLLASLALTGQWTTYVHPVTDRLVIENSGYAVGVTFAWLFTMNAVRRLHDRSHNGYWILLGLVPGVNVFLVLYLLFAPSSVSANRWGPSPFRNPYRGLSGGDARATEEDLARQEQRNRRFLKEDGTFDFDGLLRERDEDR